MTQKLFIKNSDGQDINVFVEGPTEATRNVLMVHGNGVDMHGDYYDDLVPKLNRHGFRGIRLDFRGMGKSEGLIEDGTYSKYVDDIACVLTWARKEFGGEFNIVAHSMGCSVVALLCPDDIARTVMTGIPSSDTEFRIAHTKERTLKRPGGVWDEQGISIAINRDGAVRRTGPGFWKELRQFDAIKATTAFAAKTKLLIIRPEQDDVVPDVGIKEYAAISGLEFITLPGDHRFSKPDDRKGLMAKIIEFLI